MRLASYMMASLGRPDILIHTLRCLQHQVIPEGWGMEIVVAAPPDSRCVSPDGPARIVWTQAEDGHTDVGCQNTAAMEACAGEILLLSGDDDLHDPGRLEASIAALEHHSMAGYSVGYRVNTVTGAACRWDGPPNRIGSGMCYRMALVREVGGWGHVDKWGDGKLRDKLASAGHTEVYDMGPSNSAWLWVGERNLSQNLAWPERHKHTRVGNFRVSGDGPWHALPHWPEPIARELTAITGQAWEPER